MPDLNRTLAAALGTALTATVLTVSAPATAVTAAPVASAAASPQRMYVAVNVATVWTKPQKVRPVDRPALTDPAQPGRWVRAMTLAQKLDLSESNRTQTQALYGAPVLVLAQEGGWSQVVVPGQPTPRDDRGYPGWIPSRQLTRNDTFGAATTGRFALVDRGITTGLFRDKRLRHKVLALSTNTRLPVLEGTRRAVKVLTPDRGAKWLPRRRVSVYRSEAAIPRPTGRDLVRTARTFLRQPYVWAGRSGFGFDCSGLTGLVYQAHGITIPRDSDPQSQDPRARRVAASQLRAGDLLFYSTSASADDIHHVAMYVGRGRMIEAYDSRTSVRITKARLTGEYWGAVRYLR